MAALRPVFGGFIDVTVEGLKSGMSGQQIRQFQIDQIDKIIQSDVVIGG